MNASIEKQEKAVGLLGELCEYLKGIDPKDVPMEKLLELVVEAKTVGNAINGMVKGIRGYFKPILLDNNDILILPNGKVSGKETYARVSVTKMREVLEADELLSLKQIQSVIDRSKGNMPYEISFKLNSE